MSRKGSSYDNAFIESFFSSLKYNWSIITASPHSPKLALPVFDYIETFYNRTRLHSSLDYQTPINFESQLNPNHP